MHTQHVQSRRQAAAARPASASAPTSAHQEAPPRPPAPAGPPAPPRPPAPAGPPAPARLPTTQGPAGPRAPAARAGPGASAAGRERLAAAGPPAAGTSGDRLRAHLDAIRLRALGASSWYGTTRDLARLLNRDQVVPVTARLTADDLAFLSGARAELLAVAGAGLQLAELHQPLDDGVTGADPPGADRRCQNCMWRWPCPTFRILAQVLDEALS
jgi:hypothetical protein